MEAVKQKKTVLRREQSLSSIGSAKEEGSRTLPRQSSRAKMVRQQSRGSIRRQQSSSRMTERKVSVTPGDSFRDVYTDNKNAWQQSLRGVSKEDGESTRGRSRTVRSQSTSGPAANRSNQLEPPASRR